MMPLAVDLTGTTYGQVVVVRRVFRKGSRSALWECRCSCGTVFVTKSHDLRRGHTKSCGCLRKATAPANQRCRILKLVASKTDEEMAISRMFTEYKGAARKFRRPFELSVEEFAALVRGECHYCGAPPFAGFTPRTERRGKVLLNGVDRVDSERGYTRGNVVSCCKHCNRAKLDRTEAEFVEHCRRVVEYHAQKMGVRHAQRA